MSNIQNDKVLMKFYLSKIKKLIIDESGKMSYIDNFDHIIYDIFGIKNFTKRLNQCYDNRDTIAVLNQLGFKILNSICKASDLYGVFAELVAIDGRIAEIRRRFKKASKKGKKRDKDLVDEYEWLIDLYKRAVKSIRKRFGIKSSKKSYKRRYSSLVNIVNNRRDYDYDVSSVLYSSDMDDLDFDDEDDDFEDDDGDDGLSELERFRHNLNHTRPVTVKRGPGRNSRRSKLDDYDLDSETDSFDNEEDDSDLSETNQKIDKLADVVTNLANTVQYIANTSNADPRSAAIPRPVRTPEAPIIPRVSTKQVSYTPVVPPTYDPNTLLMPLIAPIQTMINQQSMVAKALDDVTKTNVAIYEYLQTLDFGDDEDDSDLDAEASELLMGELDKYPDLNESSSGTVYTGPNVNASVNSRNNSSPSVEKLIDDINHSDPTNQFPG
jgi:hypothetical protein